MAPPFRTAKRWMTRRVTPDYTNQLDLFSEAPIETTAPVVSGPVRTSGTRPPRPQQLAFDVWEPLPPEDSPRPAAEPAPATVDADEKTAQPPPEQTSSGQQDETSPGMSAGERREPRAGNILDIEPEEKPSCDFQITAAHRIGQGGLHQKARDNIDAIRLLKTLEAENREATDDEKPVLARYVGWGAMPNVFGHIPPGEWRNTAGAVKELLTGPEFESARASTPNAHFTSPAVIDAIWTGLQRIGLGK